MKRKKIPIRVRFWFKDGSEILQNLNEKFSPLGHLMSRLLAENLESRKVKFINHQLKTEKTYALFPQSEKNYLHEYGDEIWYNDCLDLTKFSSLSEDEQKLFLWEKIYVAISNTKTKGLKEAIEKAYHSGLDANLACDYNVLETEFELSGDKYQAVLRICFEENSKSSSLLIYKSGAPIYCRKIDDSDLGNSFFLEMYNSIEVNSSEIIIKGDSDIEYLPLKIKFKEIGLV